MTEGKLKQELKKYYDNYKLDPDITEDFKAGIFDGTKAASRFLDEAKKEFPLVSDPNDKDRLMFYDMLINQLPAPKMSNEQRKELLIATMECFKWFKKWFGDSP
jgi:hypothetical protein